MMVRVLIQFQKYVGSLIRFSCAHLILCNPYFGVCALFE